MAEDLWRETGLYERLLWKNHSQHRHARYYQRCLAVCTKVTLLVPPFSPLLPKEAPWAQL